MSDMEPRDVIPAHIKAAILHLPSELRDKILECLSEHPVVLADDLPDAWTGNNMVHPMMPALVHHEAANLGNVRLRERIRQRRPFGIGQDLDAVLRGRGQVQANEYWFGPGIDTLAVSCMRIPRLVHFGEQQPPQRREHPLERILSVESGFGTKLIDNLGPHPCPAFHPRYRRQFAQRPMDTPINLDKLPRLRHLTFAFAARLHESLLVGRVKEDQREGFGEFLCHLGPDNKPRGVWFRAVALERFEDLEGANLSFWARQRERSGHPHFSAIIHVSLVRDEEGREKGLKPHQHAEEWVQVVEGSRLEKGTMPVIRANWHRARERIGNTVERVVRKGRRYSVADTYLYYVNE